MKKFFLLGISIALLACQQQSTAEFKTLYSLPKKLKEVSGITYFPETNLIYAIEDSGNKNEIYAIKSDGKIARSIVVSNATNVDWEDITKDKSGNIYIGDFVFGGTEIKLTKAYTSFNGATLNHALVLGSLFNSEVFTDFKLHELNTLNKISSEAKFKLFD